MTDSNPARRDPMDAHAAKWTGTPRLAHCMFHVRDLEQSIRFYQRALDFAVADRHRYEGHSLAYLNSPGSGIEIELVQPDLPPPDQAAAHANSHLGFVVENLEQEFSRITALGARIEPIEDYVANGVLQTRFFYFYDPDGHQIEILEARGRYAPAAGTSGSAAT